MPQSLRKNANQQRDEQESKTGTSERKNSTTDREMCEIEWVFVKASNKASQGRKKRKRKKQEDERVKHQLCIPKK